MGKVSLAISIILIILIAGIIYARNKTSYTPPSVTTTEEKKILVSPKQEENEKIVADNLEVPWSLVFLPDSSLLFTQRPGKLNLLTPTGELQEIATISEVLSRGEGGLLGVTIHPDFKTNNQIYLYYTYSESGGNTKNRVVRYVLANNTLTGKTVIVDAIPGSTNHNGGRIKFGPDKYLYITTGDAAVPSLSQNKTSLAGKILRVTDSGEAAPGNPFNSRIYSYGHRNPQGLSWDSTGQLWATEHGNSTHDEVNKIVSGGNYGWPTIQGSEKQTGFTTPVLESGNITWAPGGALIDEKYLFYTGLRGESLYRVDLSSPSFTLEQFFKNKYGRIRDIVKGPDGMYYLTTSNRDGRGSVQNGDDKIIKINPTLLRN